MCCSGAGSSLRTVVFISRSQGMPRCEIKPHRRVEGACHTYACGAPLRTSVPLVKHANLNFTQTHLLDHLSLHLLRVVALGSCLSIEMLSLLHGSGTIKPA